MKGFWQLQTLGERVGERRGSVSTVVQNRVQVKRKWEGIERGRCRNTGPGTSPLLTGITDAARWDSSAFSLKAIILPAALLPAASRPPRSLRVPSLLILLIFLSSQIFLISRQHALAAPSLNLPINAPPHCLHSKAHPRPSLSLGLPCPFFLKPSCSPSSMSPMISLFGSSRSYIFKCKSMALHMCP